SDHIRLRVSEANIVELIQEIFLTFKDKAERHDIHYQFQSSDPEILLWFDRDKIEKVLYNLLSNAFKFTPDRQQISVHIHQKENGVFIEIKDTGIGIKKKDRPHIFQRFYEQPKDALQQGSGIGLSMSKELIELHRGSISVESEYKKGSTFIIQLPYGKTHFKTEDIDLEVLDINKIEHYDTIQPTTFLDTRIVEDNQDGKGHLLIVEDNTEIAQYIYSIFQNQYQTQIAENGKIALKKIQKQLPDLIISDVMMPKMDGITFCQKIKADLATSHVPVLLLTARTASIQELEGLKIGADDYITKPFDPELLRLKVANIITTRKKLHERIAVDQSFNPKEVELAPADQVFLQQVLDLMEANIENTNFDIEQFAQDLALSRSILFKKIKALTNQTPKNLMKEMRLKRAAQLLETKELKVSEVAYQAGFSDPKYFAKCFQ
ncbi:MAG: ATP-binding protein, partial [Bacteroidota bacterium]